MSDKMPDSKKYTIIFAGAIGLAILIMSTVIFPFWHLIREDVFEDVEILSNDEGICYVDTKDLVPKKIENCDKKPGDIVTIKFGRDLAWAEIVTTP